MIHSKSPISLCLRLLFLLQHFGHLADGSATLVRLYRHLLRNYEPEVRPSPRHDAPVNVSLSFALTQIIDVDERNQILTTNAWVRQNWIDYKLVWDPKSFENVTRIHIPHYRIWRPDIILYNNAEAQYMKSVLSTDVVVNHMGNVTWTAAAIFKSSCPLDVRFYPFDLQNCVLKFASWAYDGTKINISLNSEQGDSSYYMVSTEWELLRVRGERNQIIYSCCEEPYPYVDIHIRIQRRPMFYVYNLILPCALVSAISLLGFYMPSDSGEKVTLGITSLLSTTVFLMLVAEGMPPTSEALPLIGIYYGITIFIVSLATATTVVTLNVHHYGIRGTPVPPAIQTFVFNFLARALCVTFDPYHSVSSHVNYIYQKRNPHIRISDDVISPVSELLQKTEDAARLQRNSTANGILRGTMSDMPAAYSTEPMDNFEKEFLTVLDGVHSTIERHELRLAERDRRDDIKLEWQQVALVLDRFLLICFVSGTALVSFLILYQPHLRFLEFD